MDEVATKIIDILKKHMKEPRDDIGLDTALTDLKIESLDLAMIVFDIEDTFGIEIPYNANEEAADFKTVGSVVDRVRALIAELGLPRRPRPDRAPRQKPALRRRRRLAGTGQSSDARGRRTAPRRRDGYGRRNADRHDGARVLGRRASARSSASARSTASTLDDLKILIGAQIKDFDPKARLKHFKRDKIILHADRYSWFAAAAADEAVKQSGLEVPFNDPYRAACIIGSGAGGLQTIETCYRDLFIHKKRATHPLTLLRIIGSSAAAHVGIEFGVKGPTFATCSACSTAAHAIGIGRDYIRHGLVDVAIVGASESVINYGVMRAWQAMHVLSPEGCFPFAKKRNGTVLAEGAGILVLEVDGARQGARRQDPGRAVRLRHDLRQQGHGQPGHRGPERGHAAGARGCRSWRRPTSTISTPTARRRPSTTATRPTPSRRCSASTPTSSPSPRPSRCTAIRWAPAAASRRWPASRRCRRTGCRRPSASTSRTPSAISTTCRTWAATKKVTYAMSNSFAFGGLNAVLVFGPPPA